MPEQCGVCGGSVLVRNAAHVTLNTKTDAGVVDHYVCANCYQDRVRPLFE